jgi:hypothetical protein
MNLIKTVVIALFLLIMHNGEAQTYSKTTSDKEIYDFLNNIIKFENRYKEEAVFSIKKIRNKILPWDIQNFIAKDSSNLASDRKYVFKKEKGSDTLFKPQDKSFLIKQFKAIKESVWHKKFKNSLLKKNEADTEPNRYSFSIPLFSIDKKQAIVIKKFYTEKTCYFGYCFYKQDQNGNWEYLFSVNCGKE